MYPIDTSPDLIVSIQTTELSNYAIGLLFMAIAGAVLVGAVFAAVQPMDNASTVHTTIGVATCINIANLLNGTAGWSGQANVNQTHVDANCV